MKLTVDGRTVFATTGGTEFDPGKPAIVFLHGAGFDRTAWRLQTRWFAHHGRAVLAIDFPAHGWSDGPVLDSIPAMADWTARLIEAAGLKQRSERAPSSSSRGSPVSRANCCWRRASGSPSETMACASGRTYARSRSRTSSPRSTGLKCALNDAASTRSTFG